MFFYRVGGKVGWGGGKSGLIAYTNPKYLRYLPLAELFKNDLSIKQCPYLLSKLFQLQNLWESFTVIAHRYTLLKHRRKMDTRSLSFRMLLNPAPDQNLTTSQGSSECQTVCEVMKLEICIDALTK